MHAHSNETLSVCVPFKYYPRMKTLAILLIAMAGLSLHSCGKASRETVQVADESRSTRSVTFEGDSAMAYVTAQCAFGARVPGSSAHSQCAEWLEQRLAAWCDTVHVQHAPVTTFDGTRLQITNLVGVFNPQATQRVLLLAHWDCRPWADQDADPSRRHEPVMGANDAASGAAVMLELARIMHNTRPDVGVDLLFTDAEDWGEDGNDDSWALGTQYWVAHPHVAGYAPAFGILLDMVGARGACFAPEYFSTQYASGAVDMVWNIAKEAGFGALFVRKDGGAVTDDHIPVNKGGIPCIDIIDMRGESFFDGWHTTHDTPDVIDPLTLKAVGQTLSNLIYNY